MIIKYITTPDCLGIGRIIVDNKYYGIPLEVVKYFESLPQPKVVDTPQETSV